MNDQSINGESPKPKRRWLQFSLSSLFVLTFAIAGLLSGYKMGVKKRQSEEPEMRVYDVADIVCVVGPSEFPPPQSPSPLDAPKVEASDGFGHYSPTDRPVVRPPGSMLDWDSLIELVTTTISPETWAEVGGPGKISPYTNNKSLVISQTPSVHEDLEDFFKKLRENKTADVTGNSGKTDP